MLLPAALPPLKSAEFSGAAPVPTEFLMTETSRWMFSVHLAVSWMWWRISLIAGCWSTLPASAVVDAMNECTMFHDTWFCLPLSTACNWLHTSLRYAAYSLMCSGPLFTCGHLGAITTDRRVVNKIWNVRRPNTVMLSVLTFNLPE